MTTTELTPQEHIVFTEFDEGEGVLVDLNSKRYYQLNETAMLIWRCLEQGKSHAEIVGEVTDRYNVTAEHAAASVERLLRDLESHKLVRPR